MNKKHTYSVGQIYGNWKLLDLYKQDGRTTAIVECIYCGKIKHNVRPNSLINRNHACLCLSRSMNGLSNSRIYGLYYNIKDRCYNENSCNYNNYGKRGIKMCDEWRNDFISFYHWSMQNGYKEGLSIDRIDNDGPYAPWNCRWISVGENVAKANKCRVRRKPNSKLTYYGIDPLGKVYYFDNAAEFARIHNIKENYITRIARADYGRHTYKGWQFGYVIHSNEPQSTIESAVNDGEASRVHGE